MQIIFHFWQWSSTGYLSLWLISRSLLTVYFSSAVNNKHCRNGKKRKADFFSMCFSPCINLFRVSTDVRNWIFLRFFLLHCGWKGHDYSQPLCVCKFILRSLNVTGDGFEMATMHPCFQGCVSYWTVISGPEMGHYWQIRMSDPICRLHPVKKCMDLKVLKH